MGILEQNRVNNCCDNDGTVVFTHLFSAPLVERKRAKGGSGCILAEEVDELSYQGERSTLLRTLGNAGKRVRFLSEAANTKSFSRAVGCPPDGGLDGDGVSRATATATDDGLGGGGGRRSCRDGECRIVHFTGHGVLGQLTFEDEHGQLQYVDEEDLLAMLQCRRRGDYGSTPAPAPAAVPSYAPAPAVTAAVSAATAAAEPDFGAGVGYAPFEDVAVEFSDLDLREDGAAAGLGLDEGAVPRNGLQLVFLSSCHSQSVAKCFIEAVSFETVESTERCRSIELVGFWVP